MSSRKLSSSSSSSSMEDLPPSLISDILIRLTDPADLGRCRVVSKTLNALSHDVQSLNIVYPVYRLHGVIWEWKKVVTPFKEIVGKLISCARCLESITIGPEKKLSKEFKRWGYSDATLEDIFFTKVGNLKNWLPSIGGNLKSLSLCNFGPGCSWKKTDVLVLISKCCEFLLFFVFFNIHYFSFHIS